MCLSSANVIALLRPSPPPSARPHLSCVALTIWIFMLIFDGCMMREDLFCVCEWRQNKVFVEPLGKQIFGYFETPRSVVEKFASKEETGRVTDSRDFLMPTDPTDSNDATEWSTLPKVSDMVHRSFWIHCMQSSVQKEHEMVSAIWSLPRSFWEIHIAHIIWLCMYIYTYTGMFTLPTVTNEYKWRFSSGSPSLNMCCSDWREHPQMIMYICNI